MLSITVLGPVEVRRDGAVLPLPSGKTTEVLVRLAIDAGAPVRADRLIDDLWADVAATTGRNTLQSKVSQLRRALGVPGVITSGPGGYALDVEPGRVDALRVVTLATTASDLRQGGDLAAAAELSAEALALFRGDVLVDAGDGPWLQPHRARLEEVRLGLLEDHFAARVELGAGGDVTGQLEALVQLHPLREGLWHSLITALYRNGRQADALAAYGRVRDILAEELGLDPGRELQALEASVLRQVPWSAAAPARQPAGHQPPVGNLPRLSSPLIGRTSELDVLGAQLEQDALVTLTGPAGVGKTRLAIELARQAAASDGVWLIRLDAADATTNLLQAVAETMHLPGERMLLERLAGSECLLVLDNCEHVAGPAADLASALLDAAPRLTVLATSQLPLGLDGESVYPLEPLPITESVQLFTHRATEIRRQFVLDDDTAPVVEQLCQALDGLPLAIELAAARVRPLSVREIARRLDDRFGLLQDPTSRGPERRRVLAAAIAWSYELLFPDDQRGLQALSCFAGGAPLPAVESVLAVLGVPQPSALDVISRLADRSLVTLTVTAGGSSRYRLLDSIRAFAAGRLHDEGSADDALAAHAHWFGRAAQDAAATIRGPAQPRWLAFVHDERSNIDAALAWCARHDPPLGVRIANGFGWAWVVLGDGIAGSHRVRSALEAAGHHVEVGPRDRVTSLLLAGWLEASAGNVARADDDLDRALGEAIALNDEQLRADAQRHLAFLRLQQARPKDAAELAFQSADAARQRGLAWERAAGLLLGAAGSMMLGEIATAAAAADEAVRLLTPIGDSWGLVHAEAILGGIAQAAHRFDDASRYLENAAAASERLGFLGQAAYHLTRLGRVRHQAGQLQGASETLTLAIQAAIRGSDPRMAATARINLARVMRATGQHDAAQALLHQCDDWYRTAGGGDGALLTRALLAATSDSDDADLEAIVDQARLAGDHEAEVVMLDALALRVAQRGQLATARQLLAAAADAALAAVTIVDEVDRLDAHRARELLSGQRQALSAPSRHPAQRDTEVVPVRRQQRVVCIQLLFGPGPVPGMDEHPAADGDPAVRSQPGADRALGEVRQRRGLLPPARRDAVRERPLARFDTVLRLAVLQDVDISLAGIGEPEPASRILLVIPCIQQQRIVAVTAEAHVGEPGPGAVGGADDERQVVEGRAKASLPVYPGADPAHPRAERLEQQREGPVELVAEAAAAAAHDLVDQIGLVQRDWFGQVNAQVLERHGQLVRPVQRAQARRVTDGWRGDADAVQVSHHGFVIHRVLLKPLVSRR
jgi:predicted ATPase/DNA-binding SARP family transcriptional activator